MCDEKINQQLPPEQTPETLMDFLEETLTQEAHGNCPSLEQLADYAEGHLGWTPAWWEAMPRWLRPLVGTVCFLGFYVFGGVARRRLQAHLRKCPACTHVVASLWREYEGLRVSHQKGWARAWSAVRHAGQNLEEQEAFAGHCERCFSCAFKTWWVGWVFGSAPLPRWQWSVGAIAMVAATAVAVGVFHPRFSNRPPADEPIITEMYPRSAPSGVGPVLPFPPNSQGYLRESVEPGLDLLPAIIREWQDVRAKVLDRSVANLALISLYTQGAKKAASEEERAGYQESLQKQYKLTLSQARRILRGIPRWIPTPEDSP